MCVYMCIIVIPTTRRYIAVRHLRKEKSIGRERLLSPREYRQSRHDALHNAMSEAYVYMYIYIIRRKLFFLYFFVEKWSTTTSQRDSRGKKKEDKEISPGAMCIRACLSRCRGYIFRVYTRARAKLFRSRSLSLLYIYTSVL